jgi:hypothetical protein
MGSSAAPATSEPPPPAIKLASERPVGGDSSTGTTSANQAHSAKSRMKKPYEGVTFGTGTSPSPGPAGRCSFRSCSSTPTFSSPVSTQPSAAVTLEGRTGESRRRPRASSTDSRDCSNPNVNGPHAHVPAVRCDDSDRELKLAGVVSQVRHVCSLRRLGHASWWLTAQWSPRSHSSVFPTTPVC